VRCSSCEPMLDAFVEVTLEPVHARRVAAHLRECRTCEELHRRLRIVDALLMTARTPDLRDDFTATVMLSVRTMPLPQMPRKPFLPMAAFYLVAAWVVAAAALVLVRPGPVAEAGAFARSAGGVLQALGEGSHALWPVAPVALSVVVSVLAVDVLLFAAVIVFYRRVRPRLTSYLAPRAEAL
jgi:anti-sigma factor RsiW